MCNHLEISVVCFFPLSRLGVKPLIKIKEEEEKEETKKYQARLIEY